MNLNEIKLSINRLFNIVDIPFTLYNPKQSSIYFVPNTYHHFIPKKHFLNLIKIYKAEQTSDDIPFMKHIHPQVMYGVIKLSEDYYLLAGPISSRKFSLEELSAIYSSDFSHDEILNTYKIHQLTVTMDSFRFANILSEIEMVFNNHNIDPIEIIKRNNVESQNNIDISHENTSDNSIVSTENFFLFLDKLLSAIAFGNIYIIEKIWRNPIPLLAVMDNSKLSLIKYSTIAIFSLCASASVRGGAKPKDVLNLFKLNIEYTDSITDTVSLLPYLINSSLMYCNFVRDSDGRNNMPEICDICEKYIEDHIYDKITVNDLANVCGVSKKKLYELFESNFGITINDYIQRSRIRRAQLLLTSSNYTVSEVSQLLGFSSQSYFTVVFEKYAGKTPGDFKRSKRKIILSEFPNQT